LTQCGEKRVEVLWEGTGEAATIRGEEGESQFIKTVKGKKKSPKKKSGPYPESRC